ncbi:MAG TPA: radical SAM protein [Chitinispirillaceae bacterium]|nr:radical SAM protein [Chitinispirillaceae bacterium]
MNAKTEDVLRNLSDARDAGCKFVDFTGGEPLLHEDLPLLLSEAKKLGFITSVTTNCLLFAKKADKLTGKIDLLHFSIDADSPEIHDQLRGVPSYSAVMESIEIALKHRLYPDLLFTYTNENIEYFEGIYSLAKNKKLMVILDPLFNINGIDTVKEITHLKALNFSKRNGVYLNRAHLKIRQMGGNHIRNSLCRAVESTIVILPDNRLALPCFHHRKELISISKELKTILNSEERNEALRRQGKYSFCEKCHINCYFDPSYVFMRNSLSTLSLISKFRYSWTKYVLYKRPWPIFRLF